VEYRADKLLKGLRVSCGCSEKSNKVQMIGRRFGRLEVIGQAPGPSGSKEAHYLCRCACGGETVTRGTHLREGHTTSCGCAEKSARFAPGNAMRFRPGSNLCVGDERIRDDLLTEFRARGVTTDGRWFDFANGSRMGQGAIRDRIAKRLGVATPMDRARKVRMGRIFKSIVAGLTPAAS
jgi:hypothetical protein